MHSLYLTNTHLCLPRAKRSLEGDLKLTRSFPEARVFAERQAAVGSHGKGPRAPLLRADCATCMGQSLRVWEARCSIRKVEVEALPSGVRVTEGPAPATVGCFI